MNKVFIGMGTCGLATGAGQVKTAVEKWAAARAMKVEIIPTGCIGYCKAEPIMDVVTDSGHRISYSNVTPDVAGFILDEVVRAEELQAGRPSWPVQEREDAPAGHSDDRGASLFQ